MMEKRKRHPLAALGLALFSLALVATADAREPLEIFVSVPPQKYFVERIGAEQVKVSVLVEAGADPHLYEPKPAQMVALSRAAAYFAIGIRFEEVWLSRITGLNPQMRVFHTDRGIRKLPMATEHDSPLGGQRHTSENHARGFHDPHVWTSPALAMTLCRNTLLGLLAVDPARRSVYTANYKQLMAEIVELDLEIAALLRDKAGSRFLVFHPAWGYFAEAYGLKQIPIELEGKEPKPAQLKRLIESAKTHAVKAIFVQPQKSQRIARVLAAAIGADVVPADPLAGDWATNLRNQALRFRAALQ